MIEIVHNPFGQEHPYDQLPEERFPRQPLASEPFTVGIVTRPPGVAKSLRVITSIDGVPQPPVEAVLQANWQQEQEIGVGAEFLERMIRIEQDVWHAALAAPPHGSTLTYVIEADDGARSQEFTLRGEAWVTGGGVAQDGSTLWIDQSLDAAALSAPLPGLHQIEWLTDGQRASRVRVTFSAAPDERFFGLGERFNALNQRGNVLDVRCYEQYKSQGKRTYMPIPFLLSSAGFGVWVDSSRWMQFDLAATSPDVWTLEADLGAEPALRLEWFFGDDPVAITRQFTLRTGQPKLPPLWSFGLWMSGNEWNTQAHIEREVNASLENAIMPSVLVIEAWSDETTFYIWNDAQYTPSSGDGTLRYSDFTFPADGKWRDPKAMIDWLHANNIRLILWQIPVMKLAEGPHPQHDADRAWFEQQGFGVHEPDGSLHPVRPFWFRGGWLWDVTNPAAREWWLNKRAYLIDDLGVDGFKTDGGEHLWSTEVVFADGRTGAEVWNEYPQRYTEAYYQFATARRESLTFSRAGFTGSHTSPAHWAGDENSTWDAFRHSILAGLSAAVSGISFWGWDIGGFSGEIPTAELYLRGTAMAAFCPIFQYHSEYNQHRPPTNYRTPWNIAERRNAPDVIPIFRHFTNVRHNLMPYIWQEAQHSAATGEPMMRALGLYDANAADTQYYFGRDLLVCPVTEPDATMWDVYLPDGQWHDLWTGAPFSGGQTITLTVPLDWIPVFVRDGAEIPVRLGAEGKLGDAVELSSEANAVLTFGGA